MRTVIESRRDGSVVVRCTETGERWSLADIGRCYLLTQLGAGYSVYVANGLGWAATLRRIRLWLRHSEFPVSDVHMPDLY